MGDVVTMQGTNLMRVPDVLRALSERTDLEHVVVVASREDGFLELWHDRQPAHNVVLAAKVLDGYATDTAMACLQEEDG